MKVYCVSDYVEGVINPPPPSAIAAENIGKGQELLVEPREITRQPRNVGKGKTPADLLELIPSESPIQQAQLFETARAAGIHEKYARRFLSSLIAEQRVTVLKIPREKAKSALGYMRGPSEGIRCRAGSQKRLS